MTFSKRALFGALPVLLFLPVYSAYYLIHRQPPPESDSGYMVATGVSAAFTFITQGWIEGLRAFYFYRMGSVSLQPVFFGGAWILTGGPDSAARLLVHIPVLGLLSFFVWRSFSLWLSTPRALLATAFLLSFPFVAREALGFEHLPFVAFATIALYGLWRSEYFTRPWPLVGSFCGVAGALSWRVPESLVFLFPLIALYVLEAVRIGRLKGRDARDVAAAIVAVFAVLSYWAFSHWYAVQTLPQVPWLVLGLGLLWEWGRRRGVHAGLRNFFAAVLLFGVLAFGPMSAEVFIWMVWSLFSGSRFAEGTPPEVHFTAWKFLEFFGGVVALALPIGAMVLARTEGRRWGRMACAFLPPLLGALLGFSKAHYFITPIFLLYGLSAIEILNARLWWARAGAIAMLAIVLWNLKADFKELNERLAWGATSPKIFEQISKRLPAEARELRIGVVGRVENSWVDPSALWLSALRQGRNWNFLDVSAMDMETGIGSREEWDRCFDRELDYLIIIREGSVFSSGAIGGLADLFRDLSTAEKLQKPGFERVDRIQLQNQLHMELFKGHMPADSKGRGGYYFLACDPIWDKYMPGTPIEFIHGALRRGRFSSAP